MEASLYIHVPFCSSLCAYCDFYSVKIKSGDKRNERYIRTLLSEGERLFKTYPFEKTFVKKSPKETKEAPPLAIPTVFIGGGTPSVLGVEGISKLLYGINQLIARYSSSPPTEITIEANPESMEEPFLAAIREAGVSRLSVGIQTFYGPSRRAVNRAGDETLLYKRLLLASEYFPGAFSVDLISGLPYQSEQVLQNDIAAVLLYKPVHVSLYALTTKAKTNLRLPDKDEADRLWISGRDALEKSGYGQYEVSNFCLKGKESKHNIRYWLMKNWLALGPAASGTIINDETGTGFRYTITGDVDAWLAGKGCWFSSKKKQALQIEELDTLTLIKESLLMGFRYIEGPDVELFRRRFHREIGDLIPKTLKAWGERNVLQEKKLALTKEGLLFLDRFLVDAFDELDVVFSTW